MPHLKSRDKRAPTTRAYHCSSKVAFASERVAQRAADNALETRGQGLYPYKCTICKEWHLTSRAPRPLRPGLSDEYANLMRLAEEARKKREAVRKESRDADVVGS